MSRHIIAFSRQGAILVVAVSLQLTLWANAQQANTANEKVETAAAASKVKQDDVNPDGSRRGSLIAVPIPTSSAALGTGATIFAGYIFPLNKKDKVSPPSVIGGAAMFTNNGTRGFLLGSEMYFKQDRYHVLTGVAHGDLNYDFYGIGNIAGNTGRKFGVNQKGTAFFGEIMRRIGRDIFVGPRIWIGSASLAPQRLGTTNAELPPFDVSFSMRALGFKIERDTTPNRFYPEKGTMLHFGADFFAKGLGSTFSFQTYRLTFNAYHRFGDKQVLAYNAFVCATGGNAPFFGKCIFGMQNELRGYPAGRYIDRQMLATQLEYRRHLFWRLGIVAFGGVGEVAPSASKFNAGDLLPTAGAGARFTLSNRYHVNLRADIARGKDEHTFSMGIGEVF